MKVRRPSRVIGPATSGFEAEQFAGRIRVERTVPVIATADEHLGERAGAARATPNPNRNCPRPRSPSLSDALLVSVPASNAAADGGRHRTRGARRFGQHGTRVAARGHRRRCRRPARIGRQQILRHPFGAATAQSLVRREHTLGVGLTFVHERALAAVAHRYATRNLGPVGAGYLVALANCAAHRYVRRSLDELQAAVLGHLFGGCRHRARAALVNVASHDTR